MRRDPGGLGASVEDVIGSSAYGIDELRQDLNRFVFLLEPQRRRAALRLMTNHSPGQPSGTELRIAWPRGGLG